MLSLLILFLSGILGGVLTGLLGIGGGIVYVLILPYIFNHTGIPEEYMVQFTIANSLFGIFFASLAANLTNLYYRDFYLREALWVGLTGVAGALIILKTIVNHPSYSPLIFNGILVVLFIYMLISLIFRKKIKGDQRSRQSPETMLGLAGGAGGILSALTGGGGGVIIVPILTVKLKMNIKKAKSISLTMILLTSLGVSIMNFFEHLPEEPLPWQIGFIYFPVAVPLVTGVLLGSPLGVRISRMLSSGTITVIFGFFMLILIIDKTIHFIQALMQEMALT